MSYIKEGLSFTDSLLDQIEQAVLNGKKTFTLLPWNANARILFQMISKKFFFKREHFNALDITVKNPDIDSVFDINLQSYKNISTLKNDVVVITEDHQKEAYLKLLAENNLDINTQIIIAGMQHQDLVNPILCKSLNNLLVPSLASGYKNTRNHLFQCLSYLKRTGRTGAIAEFGICQGGTTALIADLVKELGFRDVKIIGFDIFDQFPESKHIFDLFRHEDYEFKNYEGVQNYCESLGVEVVKGDISKTYTYLENTPLMLSFFDTDNYSADIAALPLCYKNTIEGGAFLFDHYITDESILYTIGERLAADEFFGKKADVFHLSETGVFLKMPMAT